MELRTKGIFLSLFLAGTLLYSSAMAKVSFIEQKPMTQAVSGGVGPVKAGPAQKMGFITWGEDLAAINGAGNSLVTQKGSIFEKEGVNVELFREDDFVKQIAAYRAGITPFLRGTIGQINLAAELLNADPRTKPVFFYQLSWSGGNAAKGPGGDCLVVKGGINSVAELKGKTIVLQAYGPHMDYLITLLKDAGLTIKDVNVKYVKDLTGTDNTPMEAFYENGVDAVFTITPDALKLTSDGKVGTGSEGSVKGAKILMSTNTAKRVITDVYAVRSDFFQANRGLVEKLAHALLLADQSAADLMKNRDSKKDAYKAMAAAGAKYLLDSDQAVSDLEALYGDCEPAGFAGNVQFFTDANWPRNFNRLTDSIQTAYVGAGLLSKKVALDWAGWDYDKLRTGLNGTEQVAVEKFNKAAVDKIVAEKVATGSLSKEGKFSFEVNFRPNQDSFPAEMYAAQFDDAIEKAATYTGAVVTIEGHSDVLGYLQKKKTNAPDLVLNQQRQAAKNLSVKRAMAVRDALIAYAASKGLALDQSQFTVVGYGITQPKTGMCGSDPCAPSSEQAWLSNMRVVFQFISVEAEADAFKAL